MSEPLTPAARRRWMIVGFFASALVQLAMIVQGLTFLFDESDAIGVLGLLISWCVLGTFYVLVCVIVLGMLARRADDRATRPSRIEVGRPARIVSLVSTIVASLIGVAAAIQLVSFRSDPDWGLIVGVVGVWAMLLSWGLLHWGFAQLYYQEYYASPVPTMRFPETPQPRLTDFVYFSHTLGTSFAASDVEVRSSALRWRVTWHSVLSFFFNGLIIVFALNTILAAGQG